ncbi:MAG: hypothetical protein A2161_12720 [Candidatus Schekmanbacteria bacterium RBG_13_48_7]|uniref:Uncharacterized protein n=1 Tax=Candidatus Schekmanbacteria bacterium RBG_13_48_7 TaxID=1817878 RepID=A0A1F7S338_9BACT|nr:MAG: hypothetical protein A2161_12720 [Candidatus Schekmanbacteria bacterium RBG_13_48_7]
MPWTSFDAGDGWFTWTGMPFWVNITNPAGCTWEPSGSIDTSIDYILCPGFNLVSLPVFSTSIVKASDLLGDIDHCSAVYRWKRSVSCASPQSFDAFFSISDPVDDFFLIPGHTYWVNVTTGTTWYPPGP